MHLTPTSTTAALALTLLPLTTAQTFTSCDPTKRTCPPNLGLNQANYNADFTRGPSANTSWSAAAYTFLDYTAQGAEFTISQPKQAPTIETDFYFFFGRLDVEMRAAPGRGIVSSIVLESDTLDEVDWEFVGGDRSHVQTNYFGKGNTTTYDRVTYVPVEDPMEEFHTYSLDWTPQELKWIIDGEIVRTLRYEEAVGGSNFPQTPMQVKLGNWAGGGPGQPEGTVLWAGGETDFEQGPFTMVVRRVSVTNYNPAERYEYGDRTGSWESIRVVNGTEGGSGSGGGSEGVESTTVESIATLATRTARVDTEGATLAPTRSHLVEDAARTQVAVNGTETQSVVGGVYTGSPSVSTDNEDAESGYDATALTSDVPASTTVPGLETAGNANSTAIATSLSESEESGSATTSGVVVQTDSGASSVQVWSAGGLMGVVLAALIL